MGARQFPMKTAENMKETNNMNFTEEGYIEHFLSLDDGSLDVSSLPTESLEYMIEFCNQEYRAGAPYVSDQFYDHVLIAELKKRNPEHYLLHRIEPEPATEKTVDLPKRMLSTDKAYSMEEIHKWTDRIIAAANELGIPEDEIIIQMTHKLDGYAGYDDGVKLYTRGDGYKGTDISRAFARGLIADGGRGQGPGEIVVNKKYFQDNLAGTYENSRNIIASVIKEGELDPIIQEAVSTGNVRFIPFASLNMWLGKIDTLLENFFEIKDRRSYCEYDTDGIVLEVTNKEIKELMRATNHHHRWQISFKVNGEGVNVKVLSVTPQTSKVGRITPVAELEPTMISGVLISRVTCHHYGNVIAQGINAGATLSIVRSGEVIPYIESVILPAECVKVPQYCPSCGHVTKLEGDNLYCTNEIDCPAQIEGRIEYFMKALKVDGFGPAVVEKIVSAGITYIPTLFKMTPMDFMEIGFGEKTAHNLVNELWNATQRSIFDWRFLAAFSIPSVGKGGCEKLLKVYHLNDIFELDVVDIIQIDGFAEKTAEVLVDSLVNIKDEFDILVGNFNIQSTTVSESDIKEAQQNLFNGKSVVFTGTMEYGNRNDMSEHAKSIGMKVGSSVSSKTDFLVCGSGVGKSKLDDATKHGTKVLSEAEYNEMII